MGVLVEVRVLESGVPPIFGPAAAGGGGSFAVEPAVADKASGDAREFGAGTEGFGEPGGVEVARDGGADGTLEAREKTEDHAEKVYPGVVKTLHERASREGDEGGEGVFSICLDLNGSEKVVDTEAEVSKLDRARRGVRGRGVADACLSAPCRERSVV